MIEASLLLIGWLLGLLSPEVVERIRRRYRRHELGTTIAIELDELRYKLVINGLDIGLKNRSLDRETLQWAQPIVQGYTGVLIEDPGKDRIVDLVNLPEEELDNLNALPREHRKTTTFPKYTTPFLDSQLPRLSWFSLEMQRRLLELRSRLDIYHAAIDQINMYHDKTFDAGLSERDRAAVTENIDLWTGAAALAGRHIVRHLNWVMPRLQKDNPSPN